MNFYRFVNRNSKITFLHSLLSVRVNSNRAYKLLGLEFNFTLNLFTPKVIVN